MRPTRLDIRAEDGDIRVLSRGFNTRKQTFEQAEGRAKFVGKPDVGQLKVSFFGSFYCGARPETPSNMISV